MPESNLKWSKKLQYHLYKHPTTEYICKKALYIISFPLCCCCCVYCAFHPFRYCGTRRRVNGGQPRIASIHFELKEQKVERRQSLSIGAPTTERTWSFKKKQVLDQAASPLFSKLPVELRDKIYEYVLLDTGAVSWHFEWAVVNTGGVFTIGNTYRRKLPLLKAASCLPTTGDPFEAQPDVRLIKSGDADCSLLQTCRAIYTEALPILYSNTQFVFHCHYTFSAFLKTTPITKLEKIRSIRVECLIDMGWNLVNLSRLKFCKNLQTMYVVYHCWHNNLYDFWRHASRRADLDLEATAKLNSNCAVWCFIYDVGPPLVYPEQGPVGNQELKRYKYINPKIDPDWRNSGWQTVV